MQPTIKVENLSKEFRIGARRDSYATLRDKLAGTMRAPLAAFRERRKAVDNRVWALRDIGFEVLPGEVVGIVGRNGAGKSTLLKVLSRITEPTVGRVELRGRVGSLLEVGTGFHPELSGRENIYMNGAVLGMRRREIERKFDEIVAFAEIEQFLETPVKRYSSGMYMRLAFAVAAHLESEILLVDEVLAVGDSAFQKKCLGKMEDVTKQGRTILFVSHNMGAVGNICNKGILLERGRQLLISDIQTVVSTYISSGCAGDAEAVWDDPATAPGSDVARIRAIRILDREGQLMTSVDISAPVYIEVEYENLQAGANLATSVHLMQAGVGCVLAAGNGAAANLTHDAWGYKPHPKGIYRSVCRIPENFLNDKQYTISAYIVNDNRIEAYVSDAVSFEVVDSGEMRGEFLGEWIGAVRPKLAWMTHSLAERETSALFDAEIPLAR
jgi:lipopolysaccharide transport system ATP-binding protein